MTFTITKDRARYKDSDAFTAFPDVIKCEGTLQQAENLAYALSHYYDAGLDEQFVVTQVEPSH